MVASLTNYNFTINYKSEKVNVDADALSQILWEDHNQYIKTDMIQVIISNAIQGTTLVEAYYCNIQDTETLDMQQDPNAMLLNNWTIAQSQDPAVRETMYLINIHKCKGYNVYLHDPQPLK